MREQRAHDREAARHDNHATSSAPRANGTISGTLRIEGGPAPGVDQAIPGTITALAASGYTLELPAGTYRVSGTSPNINNGNDQCVVPMPVTVKPANVQVVCNVP
jgi:hypothetical protein